MDKILLQMINIVAADPAVDTVDRLHRRRRPAAVPPEPGAHVHLAEAARRTQDHRRPGHRSGCGPSWRRFPAPRSTCRPSQDVRVGGRISAAQYQFTMRGDNLQDLIDLRAPHVPGVADHSHHRRRQQRSAEPRPASRGQLRPRHRRALRHLAAADRQHPLRRLRPAPGLDHVHVAEPVSRGDGSGAAILAEPAEPARKSTCAPPAASRFR